MKEQKYSYSQRIGKTTFIVNVKQSESAKKPLNTVVDCQVKLTHFYV